MRESNRPHLNEVYFSENHTKKVALKQVHKVVSPRLKNFDLQRESLKLYSFPLKKPRISETSVQKIQNSSLSFEKFNKMKKSLLLDERKMNVFKDQTSSLFYPWSQSQEKEQISQFEPDNFHLKSLESRITQRKLISEENKANLTKKKTVYSLTPREKTSSCLENIQQKARTLYTMNGNSRFHENIKVLNKMEGLIKDQDPYEEGLFFIKIKKKPLENNNFCFITEKIEENEPMNNEERILKPNIDFKIYLEKFGFQYFAISLRNRESPVKVMISAENCEDPTFKLLRFKIYLSTKTKTPNKFNAEFEYEVFNYLYFFEFSQQKFFINKEQELSI